MTIRTRNRFIKALFIFSTVLFFLTQAILIFSLINHSLNFDYFNQYIKQAFILIRYNPYCVLISLFFLNFYVSCVSYILYRSFENTPAAEAIYVCLYLIACLANCSRVFIALFNMAGTFSQFLMACGNIILFSKILYPIALLFIAMMPVIEQKQDSDRNVFLLLILCIFFAEIIPLNTVHTMPNFGIDYGYSSLLNIVCLISIVSGIVIMFIKNKKRLQNQKTTIGYSLTAIGITFNFNTTNLLQLIIGIIFLSLGSYFFFYELHKQYLWND